MNTAYNKVAKVRQIYEKVILILNRTKKKKNAKSLTQTILKLLFVKLNPHQCFHVKYQK